jgi:DNA-binding response OmpR family regulator
MPPDPSTNIVDVYMKYVRDKVDLPGETKLTHTIRGVGYELRDA